MIPKIFMQTSRQPPQQYVVDEIKSKCHGWTYEHYTDDDIIAFFGENPVPEFPNVIAKFFMLNYGEHRADLFRYYFLYVKGGVYMDLDAMIQCPIKNIIGNADFFTVNSSYFPGTVFQGFLGSTPQHPLIYQALKDIYNCPLENLRKEFHLLCKNLYGFIEQQRTDSTLLLEEVYGGCPEEAHVIDKNSQVVLIHYHINKVIPRI
jgi:mannosyltransferase OCH1-like enzyme